jgi:hypothetical protein
MGSEGWMYGGNDRCVQGFDGEILGNEATWKT